MLDTVRHILRCEEGATAIEYGLIAALISMAIMFAITDVAVTTGAMWDDISTMVMKASS